MQFIRELSDFVDGAAGDDGLDDDFDKIDSTSVCIFLIEKILLN
jgi:hypothetical protein